MSNDLRAEYAVNIRRRVLLTLGIAVLLCLAALCSLRIGAYPVGLGSIADVFRGNADAAVRHVLLNIRLPRMCGALLAGGCLALAGVAMQNVLRNPLASPFTLGVSQGAAFGAAFALIVLDAGNPGLAVADQGVLRGAYLTVGMAFLGSLVTVAALLVLSAWRELSPAALILAGVALSSFFGAAMMRMIMGQDHRFLLPGSIFAGALLLVVADVLARTVMAPVILPVGILTSFAGVPLFLYLLVRRGGIGS